MKKLFFIALSCFAMAGCDVPNSQTSDEGNKNEIPEYVTSAASNVSDAIVANMIRNPDFNCNSIYDEITNNWTIGCFIPEKNPSPFLLFKVTEDKDKTNPPFNYKLVAINGKAKQYAENKALRMFKIDTKSQSDINIDQMISAYTAKFVPK
ncbi:hypothetical protein HB991_09235 [Yersinia mollaretii]|uniref:Lipoprotein n=1 Tax=Yersinia mollaretii TaxID=33060 RepID=A0AA44HZU8_YERMO|nr:hypothetical protein [Yersinia mollaretii]NIL22696.1 hypothetical protein [Yersinia mollaretii]CNI39384.1 Uncharacterised protein [Yersinia mollaretii]